MHTHLLVWATVKEEDLEPLVEKAMAGDEQARTELWLVLDPAVEKVARRRRVTSQLCESPDARRDIVLRVMDKLRENDCALLGYFLERLQRRDGSFRGWISTVARNEAIDYVRAHPEYLDGPGSSRWARHVDLSPDLKDDRPDALRAVTLHEVFAFIEQHLRPAQREAILLWAAGAKDEEISAELGLTGPAAALRLVRSARKRLQHHFRQDWDESGEPGKNIFGAG